MKTGVKRHRCGDLASTTFHGARAAARPLAVSWRAAMRRIFTGRAACFFAALAAVAGTITAVPSARAVEPPGAVASAVAAPVGGDALSPEGEAQLRAIVSAGKLAQLRWPDFSEVRGAAQELYSRAGYSLRWIRGGHPTALARAMITQLQQAAFKGLNPGDYDASRWEARLAALGATPSATRETDEVNFDAALTVCAMRFISDLHVGRVNPKRVKFDLAVAHRNYDLAGFIANRILGATELTAVIRGIEPPYAGYERAETALAAYLELAAQGDTAPVPAPRKSLHPGERYGGLPQLAARLRQLGDLAPAAAQSAGLDYRGAIVDAVKRFQARHGLAEDGVIGPATVAALNVPLRQRVQQLDLTLERYRWLPRNFPQPPLVINIPQFRLRTMRRQPAPFISMPVIVGKAYRHQTPVFAEYMRYVIFRPYWLVPMSIQRAELVPKIRRNRNYLAAHHYEVVDGSGDVVTDGTIDHEVLHELAAGALAIRQKPGPSNSLGLIKFIFPNNYNVYLHATPEQQLFARARRDFSHGCIRVEDPVTLALWVLRNNPGWDEARIRAAMSGDRTLQVNLAKPIPVLILYATAIVTPDGVVHFFSDIYGHDAALAGALAGGRPYP
jgi:murein L,D-transpeptidase YcbB/YkuD